MIPVAWMTAGAVGTCIIALAVWREAAGVEVPLGMLAPLVATAATWVAVDRQLHRNAAGVHALLLRAFAVKVVFFAAYVVIAIEAIGVRPVPFVVSFTVYFISLYCAEALGFARLFTAALRQAR